MFIFSFLESALLLVSNYRATWRRRESSQEKENPGRPFELACPWDELTQRVQFITYVALPRVLLELILNFGVLKRQTTSSWHSLFVGGLTTVANTADYSVLIM